MEFLDYGDLAQYIPHISKEEEVKKITSDLLHGLRIMHAEGFAHRDLKPQVRRRRFRSIFGTTTAD